MSLFQQRKNKRFRYTPRHLQEKGTDPKEDLESKWQETKHLSEHRGKSSSSLLILAVILGMIIVLWFVLDHYKI